MDRTRVTASAPHMTSANADADASSDEDGNPQLAVGHGDETASEPEVAPMDGTAADECSQEASASIRDEQGHLRPLSGSVDAIEHGRIFGWAWDPDSPERRVSVDIFHAGEFLGTSHATRLRPDLRRQGIGDGRHGFVFLLPKEWAAEKPERFTVTFHGTTIPLKRAPTDTASPHAEPASGGEGGSWRQIQALAHRTDQVEASIHGLVQTAAIQDRVLKRFDSRLNTKSDQTAVDAEVAALQSEIEVLRGRVAALEDNADAVDTFLVRLDEQGKDLSQSQDALLSAMPKAVRVPLLWAAVAVLVVAQVLQLGLDLLAR